MSSRRNAKPPRRRSRARSAIHWIAALLPGAAGACSPGPQAGGPSLFTACPGVRQGIEVLPGVRMLPLASCLPELADPYYTQLTDSAIISGTAQYYLKFRSLADLEAGGPYEVVWNDYYYADGTRMEGERYYANSWDTKPSLWSADPGAPDGAAAPPRLWDPARDQQPPLVLWYGGHMRPRAGQSVSIWPDDNFSRDVFAFAEAMPGMWFSQPDSLFAVLGDWPRAVGDFLGHRYGHQIVMIPAASGAAGSQVPAVFYEQVTRTTPSGGPALTEIFMDAMASPFRASGQSVKLVSPIDPGTGRPYPSTVREDGSALVEGPLYFRFDFAGEQWEAIGFSAGSYYSRYPAAFASRRVSDGLLGVPYALDLEDDGTDLHDAGAGLGRTLHLTGGPGRPSVLVDQYGRAVTDPQGSLQLLFHAYLAGSDPSARVVFSAKLAVRMGARGTLRFDIIDPLP
jgi:hypothetical protein